eukprot:TRINITY_DN2411_c0_g1_i1.p1 TRINITY_DN2411_c0_g1~~TRINITY_DN2411_c0_g1_i1.p1  ORF type:complete len:250 (-),score=66.44 TRINITY_DN2411_c0_g1_i1:33-782(-)
MSYGESIEALRAYVTGGNEPDYKAPAGQVRLEVSSSELGLSNSRNFPLDISIAEFKSKLQLLVGTAPIFMELTLFDKQGRTVAKLDNDNVTLNSYRPSDNMRVHVVDLDPYKTIAQLNDVSQIEKYTMSEDDYNKREHTYRKFKQQQQTNSPAKEEVEEPVPENIKVGERCEVASEDGSLARRGEVMFVGKVDFSTGYWVGVKFDEPLGKNDGSVQGKRYFTCPNKYGGFVKPNKVVVGDFPEEDFDEL